MKTLNIELLALDLDQCNRCGRTLHQLEEAIAAVKPALDAIGLVIELEKRVVATIQEAEALGFVSSPTIRIGGADVLNTVTETACDPCAELYGCDGSIDCRVWPWRGETHEAAPAGLLVEAILHAAVNPSKPKAQVPWHGVPENLKKFYQAKGASSSIENKACCGPTCCGS